MTFDKISSQRTDFVKCKDLTPKLSDFDYPLPKDLIAQKPLDQRDAARLLVTDRATGELRGQRFSDITGIIPAGDILVLNDTKVMCARILGKKRKTGGKVEILLLGPSISSARLNVRYGEGELWRCLLQPVMKEGQEIELNGGNGAEAVFVRRDRDGIPLIEFKGIDDVRAFAEKIGTMPLPPYIKREPDATDRTAYQTIYAENEGAVAAPTAGLHFTRELLQEIRQKGVEVLFVTLHVGYGTFKPVEDLENHRMHAEHFECSAETADKINEAKRTGKKIWAVGTTTLRVLETCVQNKKLVPGKGETDLFIKEPFTFEIVDHLITNFHLPKTTLLLLVSAFMGEPLRKKAYEHAIAERYRFYSYGDAMLIL